MGTIAQKFFQEGLNRGLNKGLNQGLQKLRQEKQEIAINFLKIGISAADIAEATGLPMAEVIELKSRL
jgi:predicted transposase/invertase (TIGR01784 family)